MDNLEMLITYYSILWGDFVPKALNDRRGCRFERTKRKNINYETGGTDEVTTPVRPTAFIYLFIYFLFFIFLFFPGGLDSLR